MVKDSKRVPTGEVDRFTNSLIDLVTGNPINEEPSTIKGRKDPFDTRPRKKDPPNFPLTKSERTT